MKIQHSEGTGTSSCLVMNYQIDKKQKQTNRLMSKSTTVLFLLQSLLLLKFSLFCFVLSFFFFWRYFIQCSFALYSLHLELCSAAGGHIKRLEILPRLHFEIVKSAER